jgi:hypothetical protein
VGSRYAIAALAAALSLLAGGAFGQSAQQADTGWRHANESPAWKPGEGPLIAFSRHNSPFVANGLHRPLAALAQGDGFRTRDVEGVATGDASILVLINNYLPGWRDFPAMEPPSAFSSDEIAAVRRFVEAGGSLLVLADHAPLGGGATALLAEFGFTVLNGHAAEEKSAQAGYAHVEHDFTASSGLNVRHPIAGGGTGRKPVARFHGFGGQALIPPANAETLLAIPSGWSAIFTYNLQRDLTTAPRIDASGMAQGAAAEFGKGRIAVFGEAGGFSAQVLPDGRKSGFNDPAGADNPEFVLATLRWLVRHEPGAR